MSIHPNFEVMRLLRQPRLGEGAKQAIVTYTNLTYPSNDISTTVVHPIHAQEKNTLEAI